MSSLFKPLLTGRYSGKKGGEKVSIFRKKKSSKWKNNRQDPGRDISWKKKRKGIIKLSQMKRKFGYPKK